MTVRFRPEQERAAFRARRQQHGTGILCRILGVQVTMLDKPPSDRPTLLVCNHLGVLDPLVLASQMPLAFAGKADLQRWPLIGWVCKTYGMLLVERERPSKTSSFVQQVLAKLDEGVSMLVFPEGTTSKGERVRLFKTGAFEAIAGWNEGAVLPLCLHIHAVEGDPLRRTEATWADNEQSFAAHCWHLAGLRSIEMEVMAGKPIATAGRDRKELAMRSHTAVSELHKQLHAEYEQETYGSAA